MTSSQAVSGASARAAIERELLEWMRERPWSHDEARFERLALALFAHQFAHCEPYARLCAHRDRTPAQVRTWRDIPAVPAGAFKEMALRCFPEDRELKCFRTSGTSGQKRGALHLDTLSLYEASLMASLDSSFLPDVAARDDGRCLLRILAPHQREAPESSLSHMFGTLVERRGSPDSGWDVKDDRLDLDGLLPVLEDACAKGRPVALCGTAFAFVHCVEGMASRGVQLTCPPGSRIMETGGFKGRSRELSRDELYAALEQVLGVPAARIVNQYGMTELGSQFYDSVLVDPTGPRRKLGPPWTRVRLLDPESGADGAPGAPGIIVIHDLANTGSVAAIQTADLGRWIEPEPQTQSSRERGFEVLGREAGAEARGCSIAADQMLGGTA